VEEADLVDDEIREALEELASGPEIVAEVQGDGAFAGADEDTEAATEIRPHRMGRQVPVCRSKNISRPGKVEDGGPARRVRTHVSRH
jgi:hypothetical protein